MMTKLEWIANGETGISSKTMWAAIMGVIPPDARKSFEWDVPHDPDDFRRCYRFVIEAGVTNEELQLIRSRLPWFAPIIDNWDELVELFHKEIPNGRAPKLYARLKALEEKAYELDGWTRDGYSGWRRQS